MKAASEMALCTQGCSLGANRPGGAPEGRGADSKSNQWDSVHLASALRDPPGRGVGGDGSAVWRRNQGGGKSWAAETQGGTVLCSPGERPGQGGNGSDGGDWKEEWEEVTFRHSLGDWKSLD